MVLNLLQISLNIFAIFLLQGCIQTHAGCPFSRGKRGAESFASEAEIVALLKERFNASIYSKGLDFETRVRDNPTKKNLFGACPSEKCLPSAKFRTFSGYCNNLKSSLSFGGRASRLKRLLVKFWIFSRQIRVDDSWIVQNRRIFTIFFDKFFSLFKCQMFVKSLIFNFENLRIKKHKIMKIWQITKQQEDFKDVEARAQLELALENIN